MDDLTASEIRQLDAAERALRSGEAVVVPTDTVYGLAAVAGLPAATGRLFALKHRAERKALAVLVADVDQAQSLVEPVGREVRALMERHWPGPLTLVLRRSPASRTLDLGGDDDTTVGVRCPGHALMRALARRVGPLATTSANRSGEPTPTTAAEAAAALNGPVGFVLDGGRCDGVPSTVVDVTGVPWRVLRAGPIGPISPIVASGDPLEGGS
jgi:tRNA threonylcarbamoyl adenosine modification protein (Sua5/YciO/YrdC/YwlC family)